MNLPIPLILNRNQGRCPLKAGLVHRKINPPPVPLIYINQDQLPLNIRIPVGLRRPVAQINHGKPFKAMGMEVCLVRPQLKLMFPPLFIRETHDGLLKFPAIHLYPVLMHVRKPQGLHFP